MMWVSLITALVIAHRQDRDLAAVGVCHRLLPLPVPHVLLLGHLHHADAAGGGAHPADLQGGVDLGMLNSYAGLTVPLIASATATFLFRQFFLTVPDELVEAARIDGAGPMRFFKDVLLPLSRPASRRCS
jgi:ABC-type glycerol-3-phosphate transport system permease component